MGKTRDDINIRPTQAELEAATNVATAISHAGSSHAPSNAQKNSDILQSEVEAKLTGAITTHSHAGGSGDMTKAVYDPAAKNAQLAAVTDLHANTNDPTADQKAALAGTSGTPSVTNKYVTNADARNSDARTPTSHSHSEYILHSLATAVSDFLVASGAGVFVKKTLAEVKTILDWAADIATHAALTTAHAAATNLEKIASKGAVSGYAGLDAAQKVPTVNLGGAGASGSNYLRGDQTWATPAGGGGISTLKKTADQIINGTAFQNITDLVFNVSINTDYAFKFYIVFRSAFTTTGFRFGVLAPNGAVLDFFMTYQIVANSTTVGVATWLQGHWVSGEAMAALTATITAGVDLVCMIEGRVKVAATSGTLAARVASELANNNLVIQKGSWGYYW